MNAITLPATRAAVQALDPVFVGLGRAVGAAVLSGRALDAELDRWVYIGDSTNDVLMFEHFPHSVGVANIRRFLDQLAHRPRYVTQGERGAGFAEVARAILQVRSPERVDNGERG